VIKEVDSCIEKAGHFLEWADIKQDWEALREVAIEEEKNFFILTRRGSVIYVANITQYPLERDVLYPSMEMIR
jgi:hypothetical protein